MLSFFFIVHTMHEVKLLVDFHGSFLCYGVSALSCLYPPASFFFQLSVFAVSVHRRRWPDSGGAAGLAADLPVLALWRRGEAADVALAALASPQNASFNARGKAEI